MVTSQSSGMQRSEREQRRRHQRRSQCRRISGSLLCRRPELLHRRRTDRSWKLHHSCGHNSPSHLISLPRRTDMLEREVQTTMSNKHGRTHNPPRLACFLALAVLSASSTVFADDAAKPRYSKAYDVCIDKTGGNDLALKDCTYQEVTRQDKRLNNAYRQVMSTLAQQIESETDVEHKKELILGKTGGWRSSAFGSSTRRRSVRMNSMTTDLYQEWVR
jgi:hypothetical protein